jgi:hypothetical protein
MTGAIVEPAFVAVSPLGKAGCMDVFAALSKAADVTRPGARDQLPVISVVLTVAALVVAGAPQHVPRITRLTSAVKGLNVIGFTVLILGIVAASILLQPLLTFISSVLYGEQGIHGLRWLMRRLRRRHIRRFRELVSGKGPRADIELQRARMKGQALDPEYQRSLQDQIDKASIAIRRYPEEPDHIVATLLGNVLRAAEMSAGERYGFDTVTVFPRLEPLLPKETEQGVTRHRDDLRFAVRLASALIIGAATSTVLLLPMVGSSQMTWSDTIWFLVPIGGALLAWAQYH